MTVWFNHWFSTAYRLIEQLREGCAANNIPIKIIGSNKFDTCVYQKVCDEFYLEPIDLTEDVYGKWCLEFCEKHHVDVFIPYRERLIISKYSYFFLSANIKVLVDSNYDLMLLLEDKKQTNDYFVGNSICKTPELYIVNNIKDFKNAYELLTKRYINDRICIKYNIDVGGTSFRVIDNNMMSITSLKKSVGHKLTYEQVCEMLGSVKNFEDLIVMPYLEGPEVSIDSLMTKQGFIGLARYKIGSRETKIEYNTELYNISKNFAEISQLRMPYNLQLRKHNNDWYLLEVNTRLSGGSHKNYYMGYNFIYIAFCELLGLPFELPKIDEQKSILLTEIETPILLKGDE